MTTPEVQTSQPTSFADFFDSMCADLTNEYTHMAFYLFHASFVRGLHAAEYAEFFKKAAEGEMQHISEFSRYIHGFENMGMLSPEQKQMYVPAYGLDFDRYTNPLEALLAAIKLEERVIENYIVRLKQVDTLHEPHASALRLFYENQLEDSYGDVQEMYRLVNGYHRVHRS